MKSRIIRQDNGLSNPDGGKIEIIITDQSLQQEIKSFFRWRKGDFIKRFYGLGTSKHDKFIEYLYNKGYGI